MSVALMMRGGGYAARKADGSRSQTRQGNVLLEPLERDADTLILAE